MQTHFVACQQDAEICLIASREGQAGVKHLHMGPIRRTAACWCMLPCFAYTPSVQVQAVEKMHPINYLAKPLSWMTYIVRCCILRRLGRPCKQLGVGSAPALGHAVY